MRNAADAIVLATGHDRKTSEVAADNQDREFESDRAGHWRTTISNLTVSLLLFLALSLSGCVKSTQNDPSTLTDEEQAQIELLAGADEPAPAPDEKERVANPSARIDAVAAIQPTHATVATTTVVFVLPSQSEPEGDPIFRADHVEKLTLTWKTESLLYVSAKKARPFLQATSKKVRVGNQEVLVKIEYMIDNVE